MGVTTGLTEKVELQEELIQVVQDTQREIMELSSKLAATTNRRDECKKKYQSYLTDAHTTRERLRSQVDDVAHSVQLNKSRIKQSRARLASMKKLLDNVCGRNAERRGQLELRT